MSAGGAKSLENILTQVHAFVYVRHDPASDKKGFTLSYVHAYFIKQLLYLAAK